MRKVTQARQVLGAAVAEAGVINWSEPRLALPAASQVLDRILSEDDLLTAVATEVLAGQGNSGCESFDGLDKIVLWQSADRSLRLRLHLFYSGYSDRPHNHRWTFVSRILRGTYLHTLYGGQEQVLDQAQQGISPAARHMYQVSTGSEYLLDHTLVHSLSTTAMTASLVLRGPALKDRYFTVDNDLRRLRWSSGAGQERPDERAAKAMTEAGFARASRSLAALGLLPEPVQGNPIPLRAAESA